jgi:hypothetical protein
MLTLAAMVLSSCPAVAAMSVAFLPAEAQMAQTEPQVFVRDPRSPAEKGAHGTPHVKGLRPVRTEDGGNTELFNADGDTLLFTLEKWRAAGGAFEVTPDAGGDRVAFNLHRLIAFGHYSVFIRENAPDGEHFLPLDGSGLANDFDARQDGAANLVITASGHVTSGTTLVVIYHSDGQDHGNSPGELGRTAHLQLVATLP